MGVPWRRCGKGRGHGQHKTGHVAVVHGAPGEAPICASPCQRACRISVPASASGSQTIRSAGGQGLLTNAAGGAGQLDRCANHRVGARHAPCWAAIRRPSICGMWWHDMARGGRALGILLGNRPGSAVPTWDVLGCGFDSRHQLQRFAWSKPLLTRANLSTFIALRGPFAGERAAIAASTATRCRPAAAYKTPGMQARWSRSEVEEWQRQFESLTGVHGARRSGRGTRPPSEQRTAVTQAI